MGSDTIFFSLRRALGQCEELRLQEGLAALVLAPAVSATERLTALSAVGCFLLALVTPRSSLHSSLILHASSFPELPFAEDFVPRPLLLLIRADEREVVLLDRSGGGLAARVKLPLRNV